MHDPMNGTALLRLALAGFALLAVGCSDSPTDPPLPPPVAEVRISGPDSLVTPGHTLQLQAEVRDSAGSPLEDRVVDWSSSDTTVARVTETGVVTGVALGEATLTASSEGVSDTFRVAVVRPVLYYGISRTGQAIAVGATRQLTASARDSAGAPIPDPRVRWASSDPSVLAVSGSGELRGVAPGSAELVVRIENATVRARLTVVPGYTVVALGTLGGAASRPFGVGPDGAVVGEAQDAAGAWRAFLWRNGEMTALGAPGGYSRAVAVNRGAEVVGIFRPGADTTGPARPFLWREGRITELAPASPADHVYATDINDRGQVVGHSVTRCSTCPSGTVGSAFLWENGAATDLGRLGGHQALAHAINEEGQIAGAVLPQDSAVLIVGGEARRIFPGVARATSGAGHVVGDSRQLRHTGATTAAFFIWRDGVTHEVPIFYRDLVRVFGVDADGKVLLERDYSGYGPRRPPAVEVRQTDNRLFPLNEMLAPGTTWTVEGAAGMNDRGEIVGYGKHPETGEIRALLLKPRG